MRKGVVGLLFVLGFLFTSTVAQAGGAKTPISVSTIGGSTATASVTLCAASVFPCAGATFGPCVVPVFGPDLIVKQTCGPAGFKVAAFQYTIATPAGGCFGVQSLATSKTATCDVTGTGGGIVTVKVGNGP